MVMLVRYGCGQLKEIQGPAIKVNSRLVSRRWLVVVGMTGIDIMADTWSDNLKRSENKGAQ